MTRRGPLSLILIAGAAIGLAACEQKSAAPAQSTIIVRTETAKVEPYAPDLTLTGEVRARTESKLSFRTGGKICERLVDVGARVAAGQVLARLDATQQEASVANAEAVLASADAQKRLAETNYDRQKALVAQGFVTRSDFDNADKALRSATAMVEAATAQLDIARTELGYTELKADASGIVTARNADVGEVVAAALPVFTVANDGPRDVVVDVFEQVFLATPDTSNVRVSLVSDPNVFAEGHVREVSPAVDAATGTVRIKIDIGDPPPAMALGAAVSGHGEAKSSDAIVLPASALSSDDGHPAVWVLDPKEQTVSLRRVDIGVFQNDSILIRGGLTAGEQVVVEGGKMLFPGRKVATAQGTAS
ncbi:efflux RND transporter periplasmic adaptor subunit [Oryzibacter oryziterrae]|uniref:efflux RND transporter periplasmic adaptor subunit n=1 Tax=Oryzibacter oryziterrae TaxID=2766474 RepID=UPI001F02AD93|nr:efflux RND transporter periplasmic adaptor subunit [Oryzibacter oryziterrae]